MKAARVLFYLLTIAALMTGLCLGRSCRAASSTTTTWALDVGALWGGSVGGSLVTQEPFAFETAAYPSLSDAGISVLEDAAYDYSTGTLYISGGNASPNWWAQNTIAVYHGAPEGLTFVSASDKGMGDFNWLAGIEYVDGSLYAIGHIDYSGDRVLIRIVNPGTAFQKVVQVGEGLGSEQEMGTPRALCKGPDGNLLASFSGTWDFCLYSIDKDTGVPTFLHAYWQEEIGVGSIGGLAYAGSQLLGLSLYGDLYEIDLETYELEKLGEIEHSLWTALVAIDGPEPAPPVTYYVDGAEGSDAYDGLASEWDGEHGPKETIQAGLDAASSSDTVLVAPGTYRGEGNKELDYDGKSIVLRATGGPGGTIIDCEGGGRAFLFQWGETADAVVDGFSIINGYAEEDGGGILCFPSCPTVMNCIIRDCHAGTFGGGISYRNAESARLFNCLIEGCSALERGGGVFCGGRSYCDISNCTIAGNVSLVYGGGVAANWITEVSLDETILWDNTAPDGDDVSATTQCLVHVNFCDTREGAEEMYIDETSTLDYRRNNLTHDPLFIRGPLHDYYLSQTASGQTADSPCVDWGSDTAANLGLDEFTTRTDGVGDEGTVDMGYHALYYALRVSSIERRGDAVMLRWNAAPGRSYVVGFSTDLEHWTRIPVGETGSWLDTSGSGFSRRFYRVRER